MKGAGVDNGFFELKALVRRGLIRSIGPGDSLDLYAGRGRMIMASPSRGGTVHAVDRDPMKLADLTRRAAGRLKLKTYPMDNMVFIEKILPRLGRVNFIDFDAYGCPNRVIKAAFDSWRPRARSAVAVTDGGRLALLRGGAVLPGDFLAGAGKGRARIRPVSALEYELLLRAFWDGLARTNRFRIERFTPFWRRGRRVVYYGLVISPA